MTDQRIGDWIGMPDGRKFWPLDPRADEVHLADIAHSLSRICRFGGRCDPWYSVAQHSIWVAGFVEESHPHLALHALLHDAAEAYVGDQVRPIKRDLFVATDARGPESFDRTERRIMRAIYEAFGLIAPSDADASVIKHADNVALATEARDLMGDPSWPGLVQTREVKLAPMHWEEAHGLFLVEFTRLRGQK